MKFSNQKTVFIALLTIVFGSLLAFSGCSSEKPLSLEEQAQQKGMTVEEYKETMQKAAQMNMSVNEHVNMDDEESMDEMK